ncbi:MAG: hypothetical protein LBV43_14435 [Prevotella sp.]|jgi:hypothetical protein|nr:hypothetical protein [Prevotella sp.]
MPGTNDKNTSYTFTEIAGDFDEWISFIQSEKAPDAINASLTLILNNYLETKSMVNYLMEHLTDNDQRQQLQKIDKNLALMHTLYRIVLEQATESRQDEPEAVPEKDKGLLGCLWRRLRDL